MAQGEWASYVQFMRAHSVKNLIFSSSAKVYGEYEVIPVTEQCEKKRPTNPYGIPDNLVPYIAKVAVYGFITLAPARVTVYWRSYMPLRKPAARCYCPLQLYFQSAGFFYRLLGIGFNNPAHFCCICSYNGRITSTVSSNSSAICFKDLPLASFFWI